MDPAELLDYALGRLDGPRREQIERSLVRDPVLAERVARLIRNLGRLLDDGQRHDSREEAPEPWPQSPPPPPHEGADSPPRSVEPGAGRPPLDSC